MLEQEYKKKIPQIQKNLNLKNKHQVPRINKVVLNICVSEALKNSKVLDRALDELTQIAGQKVVVRHAKKAVAQFKIRKGIALGGSVTLRNKRMWTFLEKLIHFSLPRVRDFKGLSPRSFDGNGNYNFGIKEQIVFPEVDYDKTDSIRGFNITVCTTAQTDQEGLIFLKSLGFPFRK